jgi:hypothetical protein
MINAKVLKALAFIVLSICLRLSAICLLYTV